MKSPTWIASAVCALTLLAASAALAAEPQRVQFARDASAAQIKGELAGDGFRDYLVRASAGQTLSVRLLHPSNPQTYFNVSPAGADAAMFIGSTSGKAFRAMLPADGDYLIRVYLMRAAARRAETSRYALNIAVEGKALLPLPATQDARVAGTPFHASATLACRVPYQPERRECAAGVIRRGVDGTATLEVQTGSGLRRILFVAGQPVASDATSPPTFTRHGDTSEVSFGADERYTIPDAFLAGG